MTLVAVLAIFHVSYGQFTGSGGYTYLTNINDRVGIGTTTPTGRFQLMMGGGTDMLANSTSVDIGLNSITAGWARAFRVVNTSGSNGLDGGTFGVIGTGATPSYIYMAIPTDQPTGYNSTKILSLNNSGNVGIGTTTPVSIFQVSNGFVKASIGAAGGADLNYGTSYLGFNAARDASKNWQINSDGAHNGAGVIFGDVYGNILFAPITSSATGTSAQTLTDLNVKSNIVMKISNTGNVGIGTGTTAPDAKLAVNGDIHATQVKVTATVPGPDYVFDNDYKLITLPEIKDYITKNHHLPEIPSAVQIAKEGLDLGDMNLRLLKKVEELTLYLIDKDAKLQLQQKQIEDQQKINQSLQEQIDKLAKKLNN